MQTQKYIPLGKITKPQGLKGMFRVRAFGIESENLERAPRLYIEDSNRGYTGFKVKSITRRKGFFIVKLAGLDHINEVEPVVGNEIFMSEDDLEPLGDDEFYWYELVGLSVQTDKGKNLGRVQSIIPTGANDVLQVRRKNGREYLIPYIDDVIIEVDTEKGVIIIDPIPGLLD